MSKDNKNKIEEQGMKKIKPIIKNSFDGLIKQIVMGKEIKLIRDKLKDNLLYKNFV